MKTYEEFRQTIIDRDPDNDNLYTENDISRLYEDYLTECEAEENILIPIFSEESGEIIDYRKEYI